MRLKSTLKWWLIAMAGLVLAIVDFPILLQWWLHERPFVGQRFAPEKWVALNKASANGICARGAMTRDIIRRIAKPGTPRNQVERLLGSPEPQPDTDTTSYNLGMCSDFRMDYDSLVIEYRGGAVKTAYHVQH